MTLTSIFMLGAYPPGKALSGERPAKTLTVLAVAQRSELAKKFLLFLAQIGRKLPDQPDVLIARTAVAHFRQSLAGKAQQPVVLRAGRHRHADLAGHRRHFHFAAEHQIVHAYRELDIEIVAFALIGGIFRKLDDQEEIAVG